MSSIYNNNSYEKQLEFDRGNLVEDDEEIDDCAINSNRYPVVMKALNELEKVDSQCTKCLPLHRIHFIGSHNCCIAKKEGWAYAQQKWRVLKQLDFGVRFLEMDIAKNRGGIFKICHGEAWNGIDPQRKLGAGDYINCSDKLKEILDWLDKNPDEILIIKLDNARDIHETMGDIDELFKADEGLANMTFTPADLDKMGTEGGWPTHGELLEAKKRIVFINFKQPASEKDISEYTHFAGDVLREGRGGGIQYKPVTNDPKNQVNDKHTPFQSKNWPENVKRRYQSRSDANKLILIPHGSQISNKTLASIGKTAAPVVNGIANLFGKKGRVLKSDKMEMSDNNPIRIRDIEIKYREEDEYTKRDPNVTMVDFVDEYIKQDGAKLINKINRENAEEYKKQLWTNSNNSKS
jgi:hypothetical protein